MTRAEKLLRALKSAKLKSGKPIPIHPFWYDIIDDLRKHDEENAKANEKTRT